MQVFRMVPALRPIPCELPPLAFRSVRRLKIMPGWKNDPDKPE